MNRIQAHVQRALRDGEEGFTMIMTVLGLALVAMLATVAVTAVQGDSNMTYRDFSRKQAYEAAKAGIDEYAYHLHKDNGYWAKCTNVGTPTAVNQKGSTTNRRYVPGTTSASYAIELLPVTGYSTCNSTTIATATASMLQPSGTMKGTFQVRSTGFAGKSKVSIVATFKPASFLDYVYFTQLETSDPVTYTTETEIKGAYTQCSKTLAEGRYEAKIPGTNKYCDAISFVSGDNIKGPMHTNDAFAICGKPTLGRNANDPIEVSAPPQGWYQTKDIPHSGSACSGTPNFAGTFTTNSPALLPPSTNAALATLTESQFRYKGQVRICLSGSSMTVRTGTTSTCSGGTTVYSGAQPANGIVYVENIACSGAYSPFLTQYETTSECGNVYVQGTYSKPLTIAAGNDIVVSGNITQTGEEGVLGLIANNFIRVYHPVERKYNSTSKEYECNGNASGVVKNIEIDAAILAINHSFIVDSYNCGAELGNLTVKGAIAQKYRGAVGTSGGTGYLKNYEYDERLHTIAPPSFIEPVQSDWVIGRETVG
jgi:type II secretory pathway pseudopilin PulG